MKKKLLLDYTEDVEFRRHMEETQKKGMEAAKECAALKEKIHEIGRELGRVHWTRVYEMLKARGHLQQYKSVEEYLNDDSKHNLEIEEDSMCVFEFTKEATDELKDDLMMGGVIAGEGTAFINGKPISGSKLKELLKHLGLT